MQDDLSKNRNQPPLLEIDGLTTKFDTEDGVVHAVTDVSYSLEEGDILGIVGESGCGKSVHALSIMRLIRIPPGRIAAGEASLNGKKIFDLSEDEMRYVRGGQIAMIFQDPMTSLNPVITIGEQIAEALRFHLGMDDKTAGKIMSAIAEANPTYCAKISNLMAGNSKS